MKFDIGDIVTTKQSGLPCLGQIVGMCHGQAYSNNLKFQRHDVSQWDNMFPLWTRKFVYFIIYKEPQRSMSLAEYREQVREDAPMAEYENRVPYQYMVTVPEDDLEIFDVANSGENTSGSGFGNASLN